MSIKGFLTINPLRGGHLLAHRSPYPIVTIVIWIVWLLRVISPGAWWGALFCYRHDKTKSYHPRAYPMEIYLLGVHFICWFMAFSSRFECEWLRIGAITTAVIISVEIIQHHIYILAVRPQIGTPYKQYNWLRTLTFTALAYLNLTNLYATIYQQAFLSHFGEASPFSTFAFSAGEITGAGYGSVSPSGGDLFAMVVSSEKLAGVLFLAILISLALERVNRPAFKKDPSRRKRP